MWSTNQPSALSLAVQRVRSHSSPVGVSHPQVQQYGSAARLRLHLRRRFAARLARESSRTASTLVLGATWRVVRRWTAGVGFLEVSASAVAGTRSRWVRSRLLLRRRLRRHRCQHRLRRRRRSQTRVRCAGISVMARESAVSAALAALAVGRAFSWALVSVVSAR